MSTRFLVSRLVIGTLLVIMAAPTAMLIGQMAMFGIAKFLGLI